MARIYESTPGQIQLTGPQRVAGFNPVQAFDPSSQFLRETQRRTEQSNAVAETVLQNNKQDLEELAAFSETLNKFMLERAESKKKAQIAEGYAKYIRGEVGLKPKAQQQFQAKAAVLEANASKDVAVAQEVANSGNSPGTASTILSTSPALKGWEAYGAAIAQAQLAPANLETYLLSNKNSSTPVQLDDGRIIVPSQAKGYEVADVTRALTKQWVLQYGLDRINPQIIQEHGGFNLAMAEREAMRIWMKETDERELKSRQYNTELSMANTLPQALTPEGADDWQRTSFANGMRDFRDPVVVNEAQLKAIEQQLDIYQRSGDITSMQRLISNLEGVKIPGTNITYGNKNAAKFRQFRAQIAEGRKANAAAVDADEKSRLDYQWQQFQQIRNTASPEELAKQRAAFRASLTQSSSPYAMELQNKLTKEDGSIRLKTQILSQIRAGNKKPGGGFLWTEDEIDRLVGAEDLEASDAEEIKALLPDIPSVVDLGKGVGTGIVLPNVRGRLLTRLDRGGSLYNSDAGLKSRVDGALNGAMRVAFDTLSSKWKEQFERTGKYPNDSEVARQWQAETERIISLPSEEFYIDSKGKTPNILKKNLPSGQNLEIQSPVASPEQLRSLRKKAGPFPTMQATALRTNSEDYDLYQTIISNGGSLPVEITAAAKMAGFLNEDTWMAYQGKLLGKPYVPNPDKQASYQRNAAINLNAANVIRNPRSTNAQIRSALELLSSRGGIPVGKGSTFGAGDFGGLAELTSSGEGGFNSVNYGTTGSGTQINLTSMNIGEVEQLQKQGKLFAVGFAQWAIPDGKNSNLTKARIAANLPPTAKMTPENQLKMFWSYILNSNVRPDLRDYLLGKHNNLDRAQEAFAYEWAAAPGVNGRGKYDEDKAGNKATISSLKLRQALLNARRELKQLVDSGVDPFR
jgi:hypothetical protein